MTEDPDGGAAEPRSPDAPAAPSGAPSGALTRRQKVVQRTKVGGLLAASVGLLLWLASTPFGPGVTLATALGLTLWATFEIERMGLFRSRAGAASAVVSAGIAAAFLWTSGDSLPGAWRLLGALACVVPGVVAAALSPPHPGAWTTAGRDRAAVSLPAHLIIPLAAAPLLFLLPLRTLGGASALAAFVGLAKVGDIAGYYAGNAIGKRHPFPKLSPGKTVAGCVASLVAGTAVGAILSESGALGAPEFGILSGLLFGAGVNIAAQAGDLLESWLKRRAGVKDSGAAFGPSGGMLDLVDSFLLAAPLAATLGPALFRWANDSPT